MHDMNAAVGPQDETPPPETGATIQPVDAAVSSETPGAAESADAEPLADTPTPDQPAPSDAETTESPAESADTETETAAGMPEPETPTPAAPETTATTVVAPLGARTNARTPSFAGGRAGLAAEQRRRQRIEWGVAGGLAALLLAQVIVSDFDQLAASASMRPWLQRACTLLRCNLPPWREPQALVLLQRDVQADPQHPGRLRISASFRNDARWPQPWPKLRVTLSDTDGRALATRAFVAREYLDTSTQAGIGSGQVVGISVDVVDPSPRVTAFTFGFE